MVLASSPEVNLANLIINRNSLQPGFDIKKLLSTYADLRFGEIPNDVDGISINLKPTQGRPIVFISSKIPEVRQKFTMAHELGHIVIPWHIGTIVSHTNENHAYANRLYHDCEIEANRFAAELLMPSEWVESIISKKQPSSAFEIVRETAGTSHLSTFYKICSMLPIEYIGILTDLQEKVISSKSNNPRLKEPKSANPIREQAVFKSASEVESSSFSQNKIFWLKYNLDKVMPTNEDIRDWRKIIYPIIKELKFDNKIISRISGCLAYLNKPNVMHEEFFQRAQQRISSDNTFFEISQHPEFNLFLVKKIDALIKNRKNNTLF